MDSCEIGTMKANQHKLLVVDDIAANRDLLTRYFNARGFMVSEADSGTSALAMIRQEQFDVVLLDIIMPIMDGIEVLKQIRASSMHADLPVIMVSALSARHDIKLALELGANDYITKPVDLPNALTKLQRALPARSKVTVGAAPVNERIRKESRRKARHQITCAALILVDNRVLNCTVSNVSVLGACVLLQTEEKLPDQFLLFLVGGGSVCHKSRLVWRRGLKVGVEFTGTAVEKPLQAGALINCLL